MDEEKDLAKEKKQIAKEEYEIEVLELNKDTAPIAVSAIVKNEYEQDENSFKTYDIYIPFKEGSILIATINEEGMLVPNESLLEDDRFNKDEKSMLNNMLERLRLQKDNVDMKMLEKQLDLAKKKMQERENDELDNKDYEQDEEVNDHEQEDEEPREDEEIEDELVESEVDDSIEKETIAKKYNVNSKKNVMHIDPRHKKITTNQSLDGLVEWAKGKNDIYVVADKDGRIQAVLEKKGKEYEEIENDMKQTQGNIPDIKVHLIGKDNEEKDIKPLKIYSLNKNEAFATVRNEWEEFETIYCRKVPGKEEYIGAIVPEKSGKNVEQSAYKGREVMDEKYTSGMDLSRKARELEEAEERRESGAPTSKPGEVLTKTSEQSKMDEKLRIEDDLFQGLGVTEQAMYNTIPGLFEYRKHELEKLISQKAEEIQQRISEDPNLFYDDLLKEAIEAIKKEKDEREEGGMTPADKDSRRSTGW